MTGTDWCIGVADDIMGVMAGFSLLNVSALAALVPAALMPMAGRQRRDVLFWSLLLVAVAGSWLWTAFLLAGTTPTGFGTALWLTVAVTISLFAGLCLVDSQAWRLTPMLLPYLFLLGLFGTIWSGAPARPLPAALPSGWLIAHILMAVASYGLLTLAAVAGAAVVVQEHALKAKRPSRLSHHLPAVADAQGLEIGLLAASAAVLALGLLTGMAVEWLEIGQLLRLDHKTVFSLATLAVIMGVLLTHYLTGLRGRRAARLVLLAYICLTLAYPGVKFVTDVIIG